MAALSKNLRKIDDVLSMTNNVLLVITGLVITFIFSMVTLDVFLRYLFNKPMSASLSISELMVGWVIFLPYAYTLVVGGHVRVSLIFNKLPPRGKVASEIFVYFVDFIFFALLSYWAWLFFWQSFLEGEIMWAATKLPWWIGKLSMFLGSFVIAFTCLLYFFHSVLAIFVKGKGKGEA